MQSQGKRPGLQNKMNDILDFDDIVRQANIEPAAARNILDFIVHQAKTELKCCGRSIIPTLGELIIDYNGNQPIFYLMIDGKRAEFKPAKELVNHFKKY